MAIAFLKGKSKHRLKSLKVRPSTNGPSLPLLPSMFRMFFIGFCLHLAVLKAQETTTAQRHPHHGRRFGLS